MFSSKKEFDRLVTTIGCDDLKVPENARICACFVLRSFNPICFDQATVGAIKSLVTEGARNNFSLAAVAKGNCRAYFVDLRVQLLELLQDISSDTFVTLNLAKVYCSRTQNLSQMSKISSK